MIAYLTGKLQNRGPNYIVINVGGVGYQVHISANTLHELPEEGSEMALHIHTYLREDQLSLFGFRTEAEKELFQKLLKVNGIGPKLALAVLSGLPYSDFVATVQKQDLERLQTIPGIGKKTAERILLDLRDLLKKQGGLIAIPAHDGSQIYEEALSALVNLGYSKNQGEAALAKLNWKQNLGLEGAVRGALQNLGRG